MSKTVLCFGTFDGLHDGHRSMLMQARNLGEKLIVAVPPDKNVKKRKGQAPTHSAQIRQLLVAIENIADQVLYADENIGNWEVLGKVNPDIVAIGYDQVEMEKSLRKFIKKNNLNIQLVVLESYRPKELHNSIIRSK